MSTSTKLPEGASYFSCDVVGGFILRGPKVKLRVHTVKSVNDGAILDFNDHIVDVLDDREQITALYEEEEEDDLDVPLHGSDGMSAGSGSTDTWRPDSENSELTSLNLNGGGSRIPPVLNQNQRWHLERSGLIADDDENGIDIKEDDVNFKSDLALSVRHGSDSALENPKDGADAVQILPSHQPLLKRWSTAAAVHYSEAPEAVRGNKIIVPLPIQTTNLPARRADPPSSSQASSGLTDAGTDLSPVSPYDKWPSSLSHKSSSTTASGPTAVTPAVGVLLGVPKAPQEKPSSQTTTSVSPAEEETVVSVVPRVGQPLGLHLVPEQGTRGLLIQAIDRDSPAEATGQLHINDRIVDVNGQKVDVLDFSRAQDILRSAVAQGGAVRIRVSSAVALASAAPAPTAATTELQSSSLSSSPLSASPTAPLSSTSSTSTPAGSYHHHQHHLRNQSEQQQQQQQRQQLLQQEEEQRRKRTPPPLPPKPKLPADLETMLLRANYEASLDYTPDDNGGVGDLSSYGSIRRPGRKLTIDLLKGSEGLGFTVTTRDNPAGTICPIYVKSILSKGAAFKDGRLKSGDRLMEVNAVDLAGKSQDEVVNLLRGIPLNTAVVLVVARPETTTTSSALPRFLEGLSQSLQTADKEEAREKNKEILTFDIPLNDSGSAGLGVRVTGKARTVEGMDLDGGIFIMNVIAGGAAYKDGRLKPMDQLLNVDGRTLLGKNNVDAMETLKSAMLEHGKSTPCMSITVARDLPLDQHRVVGIPSTATPHTNPLELDHIIRVPSQTNVHSASPTSDISPPKPPRLYQNNNGTQSSATISGGGKADPVLIEGDDSFNDVSPTVTSSTSTLLTQQQRSRLDELKDPYDADTSIADSDPFNRDGFARQSMSEKRHAHLDPRALETYRRSKAALAETRGGAVAKSHTPSPSHGPLESSEIRRANSLESVIKGPTSGSAGGEGRRRSKGSAGRNRGCNESFRVAVDRSYDADRGDEELEDRPVTSSTMTTVTSPIKPRSHSKDESIEVLETSDASKKQAKKPGFLRGWLRRSAKKEETSTEVTTTNVKASRASATKLEEEAAKARLHALDEQQRINVHFQKFKKDAQMQKQQASVPSHPGNSSVDARSPPKRSIPLAAEQRPTIVHMPSQGKNQKLPIPLSGSTAFVTNDPYGHYMNYDEIQKILKRPAQQPWQQFPPAAAAAPQQQRQRPVSNYFEYGASPPTANGHHHQQQQQQQQQYAGQPTHHPHTNARLGTGIYGQTTRPLGQIREISQEKLPVSRNGVVSENIYSVVRRSGATPVVTPTAAAMMGSQV
ncbi:Partitioning defective 3-like protein [Hypsibius exemplaris]|uniref:Partitioning defective 3-like protein n=1 Tax=Hypsibius exemplaris TaxID=2072580 RepID=A0A1W0WLC5_HYPEX|nr:Partitioning defective 3-like protein [Hypsibius exemplaris]